MHYTVFLWSPYGIWQYFCPVVSSFFFFFLFSSPNLSRRRLDVCHTSTHGVALVLVWNVLHAARWNAGCKKLPKSRHLRTIVQLCRVISSQLRHVSTIGNNLLSSNSPICSRCPDNMVNFGILAAEIVPVVWGTPANSNGLCVLGSVTARQSSSERQPNFAALNRGRHLCSAGRPSRWAWAHILVFFLCYTRLISYRSST